MFIGIVFALIACFLWGTIYVIPIFLPGYNAIEITFMRYFFFGGISSLLVAIKFKKIKRYSLKSWIIAFILALSGHVIFYFSTVIALRFATPAVTILIAGLVPIVIAYYGNFELREGRIASLILPSIGIGLGLFLVNFSEIDWSFKLEKPWQYIFGLMSAFLALLLWSWYAVKNGQFLKSNESMDHGDWATIIGVGTFFWVLIFLGIILFFRHGHIDWQKYFTPSSNLIYFLVGTFYLGVVCSWGGSFFWNRASSYLPLSVAGPLVIFETLFGLTFAFLVQKRIPSIIELFGMFAMLFSIAYILLTLDKDQIES